jgi:hypothetical protein
MPLHGWVERESENPGFIIVRVETYKDYADVNRLNSFDVAKFISTNAQIWQIRKIQAVVDYEESAPLSNVGTVGH